MNGPLDLFIELNTDCNATGSSSWACLGHHVTFSIYGPDEAKQLDEITHRAYIEVTVTPQSGQRSQKETEVEIYLERVLERLIDVKEFPRSKFTVRISIVAGSTNHPKTVAAALNAASLALLSSGLPLRATIGAVCVKSSDTWITFAIDVTHPKLSGPTKKGPKESSLFAVYTGDSVQPDQTSQSDQRPGSIGGGIPVNEFLNLIRCEDPVSNSDSTGQRGFVHAQALELVDTMVTQMVSYAHVK